MSCSLMVAAIRPLFDRDPCPADRQRCGRNRGHGPVRGGDGGNREHVQRDLGVCVRRWRTAAADRARCTGLAGRCRRLPLGAAGLRPAHAHRVPEPNRQPGRVRCLRRVLGAPQAGDSQRLTSGLIGCRSPWTRSAGYSAEASKSSHSPGIPRRPTEASGVKRRSVPVARSRTVRVTTTS